MYRVCIQCYTYNHSGLIEDALNGFSMQETGFPFVAAIVDDASTDDTPQVITNYFERNFNIEDETVSYRKEMEYGTVLFARHCTNLNCFFAIVLLKENQYSKHRSKLPYLSLWMDNSEYIATCDGDDYWTDSMKLQTQVVFLDKHKEYSLCCHRYRIYNQNSDSWGDDYVHALFDNQPNGFSFTRTDNLKTWITKTMALMYRRELVVVEDLLKYRYICDEHLNYHLLSRGPGYCLPFVGAVYRRNDTGIFSVLSEEKKRRRYFLIRSELLKYNLKDVDLRDTLFMRVRKQLFSQGIDKTVLSAAKVCVLSFYHTAGFKSALFSIKKMMVSFIKGLKYRWYGSRKG